MERITAYKCINCGMIWEEEVDCECVTKDTSTQECYILSDRINEDYEDYIKSGAKVTFDDDSVHLSDVREIKETLTDDLEDYNVRESLKEFYQDTDENIIEGISELFEKIHLDGDIEGYCEGYIGTQDISSVIDIFF